MANTFVWSEVTEGKYLAAGIPITCRLCKRKFKPGEIVFNQGGKLGVGSKPKMRCHLKCLEESRY